jgi:hypothetical protein
MSWSRYKDFLCLAWSLSMNDITYQDYMVQRPKDITFMASVFTGCLATFNVSGGDNSEATESSVGNKKNGNGTMLL